MKGHPHPYTAEQLEWLRDNRALLSITPFHVEFNKRFGLDLKKSCLASTCKRFGWPASTTGKFHKGMTPHNKGKGGTGYSNSNSGTFKKGCASNNLRPVGSERTDKDGYTLIKISDNPHKWLFKHVHIWINANGPVPKKHLIRFISDNKANFALSNLECMPKSLHVQLNKNRYPSEHSEIKPVIKAFYTLKAAIKTSEQAAAHG